MDIYVTRRGNTEKYYGIYMDETDFKWHIVDILKEEVLFDGYARHNDAEEYFEDLVRRQRIDEYYKV